MPIGKPLDIRETLKGTESIYLNPNGLQISGSAIDVCDEVFRTLAINVSGSASSGKSIDDLETEVVHMINKIDSVYALTLLAHRVVINAGSLQSVIEKTKNRAQARLSELSQQR